MSEGVLDGTSGRLEGGSSRDARARGARVELARARNAPLASLSPVELGLGVHRHGLRELEPAASGDRAPLALRRSVGERPGPAHRLHRGRRTLLPGSRVLAGVERSPDAPSDVRTSGIAQPPLHATAAWRLFRQARDRDRGIAFLAGSHRKLRAWHAYLYRERTRDGVGWSRSGTRGSRRWTTLRSGTRLSRGSS